MRDHDVVVVLAHIIVSEWPSFPPESWFEVLHATH